MIQRGFFAFASLFFLVAAAPFEQEGGEEIDLVMAQSAEPAVLGTCQDENTVAFLIESSSSSTIKSFTGALKEIKAVATFLVNGKALAGSPVSEAIAAGFGFASRGNVASTSLKSLVKDIKDLDTKLKAFNIQTTFYMHPSRKSSAAILAKVKEAGYSHVVTPSLAIGSITSKTRAKILENIKLHLKTNKKAIVSIVASTEALKLVQGLLNGTLVEGLKPVNLADCAVKDPIPVPVDPIPAPTTSNPVEPTPGPTTPNPVDPIPGPIAPNPELKDPLVESVQYARTCVKPKQIALVVNGYSYFLENRVRSLGVPLTYFASDATILRYGRHLEYGAIDSTLNPSVEILYALNKAVTDAGYLGNYIGKGQLSIQEAMTSATNLGFSHVIDESVLIEKEENFNVLFPVNGKSSPIVRFDAEKVNNDYALGRLVQSAKANGYTFVSMTECLGYKSQPKLKPTQGKLVHRSQCVNQKQIALLLNVNQKRQIESSVHAVNSTGINATVSFTSWDDSTLPVAPNVQVILSDNLPMYTPPVNEFKAEYANKTGITRSLIPIFSESRRTTLENLGYTHVVLPTTGGDLAQFIEDYPEISPIFWLEGLSEELVATLNNYKALTAQKGYSFVTMDECLGIAAA